jgi:hypothetical protein
MIFSVTVCVSGAGACVDSAWEQDSVRVWEKSPKMQQNPAGQVQAVLVAFMHYAQLLRQLVVHIAPNSVEFYQVLQAE